MDVGLQEASHLIQALQKGLLNALILAIQHIPDNRRTAPKKLGPVVAAVTAGLDKTARQLAGARVGPGHRTVTLIPNRQNERFQLAKERPQGVARFRGLGLPLLIL